MCVCVCVCVPIACVGVLGYVHIGVCVWFGGITKRKCGVRIVSLNVEIILIVSRLVKW
jgi:hypothetical protein